MAENNEFVFELIRTIQNIIQMHVTVFVDLLLAVIRAEKRHFCDEYLGFERVFVAVQSGR